MSLEQSPSSSELLNTPETELQRMVRIGEAVLEIRRAETAEVEGI